MRGWRVGVGGDEGEMGSRRVERMACTVSSMEMAERRAERASGLFWIAVPRRRAARERISVGSSGEEGGGFSVKKRLWTRGGERVRVRPQW